jgi:hypothetical protein
VERELIGCRRKSEGLEGPGEGVVEREALERMVGRGNGPRAGGRNS